MQSRAYEYDAMDRLRRATDATGLSLSYERDATGRATAMSLEGAWTNRLAHDALGNLTNLVTANGAVHRFTFDNSGRPTAYTPPSGGSFQRAHNPNGTLASVTLPGGRTITRAYDGQQRLLSWNSPEALTRFAYADASPNFAELRREPLTLGATQSLAFVGPGPLPTNVVWSGAAQGTFHYQYNNNFNPTRRTFTSRTDTHDLELAYDRDGLLTNAGPFRLERANAGGAISGITDGTLSLSLTHNSQSRLTRRVYSVAGQTRFSFFLDYDNAGRVVSKTETNGTVRRDETYAYDAGKRLASVTRDGALVESYAFNANGNRTLRRLGTSLAETVTYDPDDRPVSSAGAPWTFNGDGQLITRGNLTLTHGARGELLRASLAGGFTATYSYDALGRRVGRSDGTGAREYFYGNPDRPLEITHTRNPAGVLTAYHYDDLGILFALERLGARFYVGAGPGGSPRVVWNTAGQIVKQIDYQDAFGADPVDSNPAFDLPIGFAGGLADPGTGLVRLGLRDYDPRAGVWITRDPALFTGGSPNLYTYAGGNPVSLRDVTGLASIGFSIYGGIGAGAKLTINDQGMSICGEAGFGFGGGLEFGSGSELDRDGSSVKAEFEAGFGPAKFAAGFKLDDCGRLTGNFKGGVGPFEGSLDDGFTFKPLDLWEAGQDLPTTLLPTDSLEKGNINLAPKFEGKVAGEVCRSMSFW